MNPPSPEPASDRQADVQSAPPTALEPARSNPVAKALYVNAALIAVLIGVLAFRGGSGLPSVLPAASAQQGGFVGAAGVFMAPAQFSVNTWGCYVMDIDTQVLAAYQYSPGDQQLRLVAARSFRYDRRLEQFNTAQPYPRDVEEMYRQQLDDARVRQSNVEPADPEPPVRED